MQVNVTIQYNGILAINCIEYGEPFFLVKELVFCDATPAIEFEEGSTYDDIEIAYDSDSGQRWFAKLLGIITVAKKEESNENENTLLLVQNYVYASNSTRIGVWPENRSIRLNWERDPKDQTGFKFDVIDVNTVLKRVHIIPDFSQEGFFFVNTEFTFDDEIKITIIKHVSC